MFDELPDLQIPGGRGKRNEGLSGYRTGSVGSLTMDIPTDEEDLLLRAIQKFQQQNKIRFPTFSQVLWVLEQLGYRRCQCPANQSMICSQPQ